MPISAAPESVLDNAEARAAIVIPAKFEAHLQRGRPTEVQWSIDGTDANTANIMRNNAAMISQAFNQHPVKHFAVLARGVMLKGVGLEVLYPNFLALVVFTAILVGVSAWRFRKQLN